jgi:hypothetical protein
VETPESPAPLCFVLMPFGRKTDAAGRVTNFDSVYQKLIAPAVEQAGLEPIRADDEKIGGTIHKPEKNPDYWDYATLLELAVLADDREDAHDKLSEATALQCEAWMLESSARNLALIRKVREARNEDAAWIGDLESELLAKAARLARKPKAGPAS